jgi:lipoate-protein ligase B
LSLRNRKGLDFIIKIMKKTWVCDLGWTSCAAAGTLQRALRELRRRQVVPDLLLLTEHPPTYTCGRSTRPEHLLMDAAGRARQGIVVSEVERGGSATYHGPGQLVGYPILDLRPRGSDVHQYIRDLEETLMRTLAGFGLEAQRRAGLTGVWIGAHKVAAIGIHVRHWITMHGFALNICPDLEHFKGIVPCGLSSEAVTSMARLLPEPPAIEAVAGELKRHFEGVFGGVLEEVDREALGVLAAPSAAPGRIAQFE